MSFRGKYILLAIDGTDSFTTLKRDGIVGSNSHVFKFYKDMDVQGGVKKYEHGPGGLTTNLGIDFGKVTGKGSDAIMTRSIQFIKRCIHQLTGLQLTSEFLHLGWRQQLSLREYAKDKLRICLVGHSRGAYLCILVAQQLPLPVYFMGLYDAVDRHITQRGLDPQNIKNVDYPYHAIRDPDVWSRRILLSFGNTGINLPDENKKLFYTTHGGIGGDLSKALQGKSDTFSNCNTSTLPANIQLVMKKKCERESRYADEWIREKAKALGLKI